jgi:hypothetical protein
MKKISIVLLSLSISGPVIFGQAETPGPVLANGPGFTNCDTTKCLNIPARSECALEGSEFIRQVSGLSLADREAAVVREILSGNVPSFSRNMRSLTFSETVNDENYEVQIVATCDYLAIGSDRDYLYIPMTPSTAQSLAEKMSCSLPTKKVVDIIYKHATYKLHPQPIPPSDTMATIPVFNQHTDSIKEQFHQKGIVRSADNLVAGHKKDIILSNRIYGKDSSSYRVVIYGWHLGENKPIQPVYNGHSSSYADYSHGVRFISKTVNIDGDSWQLNHILKDPILSRFLSSEGVISIPHYPESDFQ